jgi:hypothetical protein
MRFLRCLRCWLPVLVLALPAVWGQTRVREPIPVKVVAATNVHNALANRTFARWRVTCPYVRAPGNRSA